MGQLNKTAVSDIPFVEVSSATQTIEVEAGLIQISEAAVSSFYFNRIGLQNLIRKKYVTLHNLSENRRLVRAFTQFSDYPLGDNIAIVAVSMIATLGVEIKSVKEQIARGVRLANYNQATIKQSGVYGEVSCEELPF